MSISAGPLSGPALAWAGPAALSYSALARPLTACASARKVTKRSGSKFTFVSVEKSASRRKRSTTASRGPPGLLFWVRFCASGLEGGMRVRSKEKRRLAPHTYTAHIMEAKCIDKNTHTRVCVGNERTGLRRRVRVLGDAEGVVHQQILQRCRLGRLAADAVRGAGRGRAGLARFGLLALKAVIWVYSGGLTSRVCVD